MGQVHTTAQQHHGGYNAGCCPEMILFVFIFFCFSKCPYIRYTLYTGILLYTGYLMDTEAK